MRAVQLSGITVLVFLVASILIGVPGFTSANLVDLKPDSVSVNGEIVDNYANVSYAMHFDNLESDTANEASWFFGLQEGVRLSNISLHINDEVYWGRAMREQEAIDVYNASVEANETAALVVREYGGYTVTLNVQNNSAALLTVYVEGLLTREYGLYSLLLPLTTEMVLSDFSLDMRVRSHYGPIAGYRITGIPGFTASDLTDGVRIQYSCSGCFLPQEVAITYALDRQIGGSQLLVHDNGTDRFFVYLLAPSITEVSDRAYRQYVFVIDRSGSMSGSKIEQAKSAFRAMVGDLSSNDVFNLVRFNSIVEVLWSEPRPATLSNLETARSWIASTTASGSTNFYGACIDGLDTFYEGEYVKAMLMLSDGQPTAGLVLDTPGILSGVSEANTLDVSISTVAFGADADENLMANLAAQNMGFFAFIQPDDEATTKMIDFYKRFATPLAHSYTISLNGAEDVNTLQPLEQSPFFNGSEVVISGRYTESIMIDTTIDYVSGTENYENSATSAPFDQFHVEYIWAQHRISYLLNLQSLLGEGISRREEIISIGLDYGIIVEGYTALVLTAYEENTDAPSTPTIPTCTTTTNPPTCSTMPTYTTITTTTSAPPDYTLMVIAMGAFSLAGVLALSGIVFWLFRRRFHNG
ncbi:MAG: VWA domain-containing protein [Candidatus Thorarchaeota archaeon]|nr:VWA domain-containing protein [Candidatus Thorarchaeota archaeon]